MLPRSSSTSHFQDSRREFSTVIVKPNQELTNKYTDLAGLLLVKAALQELVTNPTKLNGLLLFGVHSPCEFY
jgi:hypothetical protein